uniref:HTH CENPB-type domain-containing protein n=1 Tax=Clastoptera arizonana TaxID=38151 RepID=A0A1B6BWE3_9HEMI
MIAKSYIESKGRKVKTLKNNVPGSEWVKSFLKRHPILTGARFAANIKRSRAAINKEVLTEYIDNLKEVTKDVPPENIWNYDEFNLTDDPGKKKMIIKRGSNPERIMNSTKTSISVMFCRSAAIDLNEMVEEYESIKLE